MIAFDTWISQKLHFSLKIEQIQKGQQYERSIRDTGSNDY